VQLNFDKETVRQILCDDLGMKAIGFSIMIKLQLTRRSLSHSFDPETNY
jgi:hypothetical protein